MLFNKLTDQYNTPLLELNSNIIAREDCLKFLGVFFDGHLKNKKILMFFIKPVN